MEQAAAAVITDELTAGQKKLALKFTEMYATVGLFVSAADAYDGIVLMKQSSNRANELIRAARHDKRMYAFLEKFANGSDLGGFILGHILMFYAIMAHHGRVTANQLLLAQLGYHESQVLEVAQPQPPEPVQPLPPTKAKRRKEKEKVDNGRSDESIIKTVTFSS